MFMVDVIFATVGYVLTMKPLDAHIRTRQPLCGGLDGGPDLLSALHPDGRGRAARLSFRARPGREAGPSGSPIIRWLALLVGGWLVFLTGVYAWATVAFGFRFSNLTHRGILTHGPYAWTKHPAYLSKNLFWWFAVLPFLASPATPST